ncbi:MAG: methyltransferase [Lachnospiraceae bacterium]|nr:methyltransferase [Lachnospiraceae bacterium]
MTSRERVLAALKFLPVDRIPLEVEPGFDEFASDILVPSYHYGKGKAAGEYGVKGKRTDYWGSIWESAEDGVKGEVRQPAFTDWTELSSLYVPYEALEQADLSFVNDECKSLGKFTMKMWGIEPFQRMQYLRGTENLFLDLAMEDENVLKLRDIVHGFYKTEVEMWCNTLVDAIHIEDDWGTQNAMLISPLMWRELFKPLYKDYCDIARKYGKMVIMHSDGYILDIIPDLIEIGINALNPQLNVMPYDKLSGYMRGKMALWGGIDRQALLPFGTEEDLEAEVHKIAGYFGGEGNTGIIGQCYMDKGARPENIRAVYRAWLSRPAS